MKLKLFENFDTDDKKDILLKLYSGIKNDHSIQRYTMGYADVLEEIEGLYPGKISVDAEVQFTTELVSDAVRVTLGKSEVLVAFAKELEINLKTLRDKT